MFNFLKKKEGDVPPDIGSESSGEQPEPDTDIGSGSSPEGNSDTEGNKEKKKSGGMFGFLKKKDKGAPDVGNESSEKGVPEEEAVTDVVSEDSSEESEGKDKSKKSKTDKPVKSKGSEDSGIASMKSEIEKLKAEGSKKVSNPGITKEKFDLEMQKVEGKIESVNALVKSFSERFNLLNQQIGEVRSMNLSTEKSLVKMGADSSKAMDIVKEVKPEKLRLDYQKVDVKMQKLESLLQSQKEFTNTVMDQIKDANKRMDTFMQTDELIKLNEDVKKDLLQTEKFASKTKLQSDKTEQLFAEMRRSMAEMGKNDELINNLDANYSGLKKELDKIKVDFSDIVGRGDFDDFKKSVDRKVALVNQGLAEIEKIKDENDRLSKLIETTLGIAQKNEKDISDLGVTIGDSNIKSISDYEDKLSAVLEILDSLAGQISEIKENVGMEKKATKLSVEPSQVKSGENVNLQNIKIHSEASRKLNRRIGGQSKRKIKVRKVSGKKKTKKKVRTRR